MSMTSGPIGMSIGPILYWDPGHPYWDTTDPHSGGCIHRIYPSVLFMSCFIIVNVMYSAVLCCSTIVRSSVHMAIFSLYKEAVRPPTFVSIKQVNSQALNPIPPFTTDYQPGLALTSSLHLYFYSLTFNNNIIYAETYRFVRRINL